MNLRNNLLFLIGFILISTSFALQTNYSAGFHFKIDFSQSPISTNFSSEFRIMGTAFGSGYDLSFSLKDTNLESARLVLKLDNIKLSFYDNQTFGTTNDPIVIYQISTGQNGLEVQYGNYKFALFNSIDLIYFAGNEGDLGFVIGKRGNLIDIATSYSMKFPNFNLNIEGIAQNITSFDTKNLVGLVLLTDKIQNWGIRYVLAGDKNTKLPYSSQGINEQNTLGIWYKFGTVPSFNTYLNTYFGFENINKDFMDNTTVGLDINFGQMYLNLKKTSFSDINGLMPNNWGKFYIATGIQLPLFDFSTKFGYAFGKPIHNTINTIGELFYGEAGRNFGNISLFAKYQKIIGYYEEKDFFYSEVKFTGFSNGEVAIRVGNGDFNGNNPFVPVVGFSFDLRW